MRTRLADDLGLSPEPRLSRPHLSILRSGPGPDAPPDPVTVAVPATVAMRPPSDIVAFTGRGTGPAEPVSIVMSVAAGHHSRAIAL